ncbi:hypothetical protein PMKS-003666 [Pichia membranifaciens]|uniref:Uncharacterized protein n=1 Tax=Pichia membranifaciens TaxID=4926 RepID=A0A1Q2YKT7_9ASCO|nr:hypothetical protein PMKS-003666 [Pichia membranifaciens]
MSYFTRSKRDASSIASAVPEEPIKRVKVEKKPKKDDKEKDVKKEKKAKERKERKEREMKQKIEKIEKREKKAKREQEKEKERKEKRMKREKRELDKERERREKKERKSKEKEKEKSSSYSLFGEDSPLENINNFQLLPSNHEKPYDLNHDLKFQRQLRLIQLSNAHLSNMAHPDFDSPASFDESDLALEDEDEDGEDDPLFDRSFEQMDLTPHFDMDFDMDGDLDSDYNVNLTPNERSSSPLSDIDSSFPNDRFNVAIPIIDDVKTGISQVDNIIDQFKFLPNYADTHAGSEAVSEDKNIESVNIGNNSDNNAMNNRSEFVAADAHKNSFANTNDFNENNNSNNHNQTNTPSLSLNLKLNTPAPAVPTNDSNILLSPSSSFNLLNLSDRTPNSRKQLTPTPFSSSLFPTSNLSTASHPPPIVLSEFLNFEIPPQQSSASVSSPNTSLSSAPAPAATKLSFEYRHNNRKINLALTKEPELYRNCRQPYKSALNRLALWSGKAHEMVLDRSLPIDEFII